LLLRPSVRNRLFEFTPNLQVLLVGQDQRSLGALIVLDVNELSRAGYITPETGNKLLAYIGGSTSPGLATGSALFGTVSEGLNTNEELKSRILGDISKVRS